ncbi:MAG: hypothetical protein ACC682_02310 [Gemmatimonadota bacterium]
MMLDGKSKMAIVASIFWMAMATVVILGTHGEAVAGTDSALPTLETTTEWMAHPASYPAETGGLTYPDPC